MSANQAVEESVRACLAMDSSSACGSGKLCFLSGAGLRKSGGPADKKGQAVRTEECEPSEKGMISFTEAAESGARPKHAEAGRLCRKPGGQGLLHQRRDLYQSGTRYSESIVILVLELGAPSGFFSASVNDVRLAPILELQAPARGYALERGCQIILLAALYSPCTRNPTHVFSLTVYKYM